MRGILTLCLSILVSFTSYCQSSIATEEFAFHLLPSKTGATIVFAGKEHGFTIPVKADSVRNGEHTGFFYVNGQIMQSSIVEIPNHLYKDTLSEQDQYGIIRGYIDYELAYFKKDLKINFKNVTMNPGTKHGRPFVIWMFDMPNKKSGSIKKQIYLTTLCFNQALSFNIPLLNEQDLKKSLLSVIQLHSDLTRYDHALDLTKLTSEASK